VRTFSAKKHLNFWSGTPSRLSGMARADAKVSELVEMIERGEIRLPEMQRKYVWKASQVRDLFDSLYKGYPSGAILLWDATEDVPLQQFAVGQKDNPIHSAKLLLDGQQRLTSLSAVLRGEPVTVRRRKRPIELLFNLDHPEKVDEFDEIDDDDLIEDDNDFVDEDDDENLFSDDDIDEVQKRIRNSTFIVRAFNMDNYPNWIPVSEVFTSSDNTKIIKSAGVSNMDDPRFTLYNDRLTRLRAIKDYQYRLDILEKNLTYDEVTEIFVRVNSLGTRLRGSDLALAQITAKWRGSLSTFQEFENKCVEEKFPLEIGLIVRNLVVTATSQSKFKTVTNISKEKLQENWDISKKGIEFALNFLKYNCGITSPTLYSSSLLIANISYVAIKNNFKLTNQQSEKLKQWTLIANAKGRYSRSSSESILDQDIAVTRDGGSVDDLISKLESQFGRLDIQATDLVGSNQRSSLFRTLFIALEKDGAQDWATSLKISLDSSGLQNKLQYHHIFPKAVLKSKFKKREIDDLANLAFIGGKTNREISNKEPIKYLPKMIKEYGKDVFVKHLIPLDEELYKIENYPKFLEVRRGLITKRLNEILLNGN
jgi:hypothetical protein